MNTKNRYNRIKATALRLFSFAVLLAPCFLSACSTDEDFFYSDEPRVRLVGEYIWAVGSDSIPFSFVTYSSDIVEKAFTVEAQIMGNVADRDRTVNLSVVSDKTTAPANLYTVPQQVTIPAGQNKGVFEVKVRRDASLQTKSVRLYVQVENSDDFLSGVNEENHLTIIWTDVLSRPNNWPSLEEFFGQYSDAKYRFMLENSGGVTDFNTDTMSWAELTSYRIKFQNALNEYNAAHPGNPLTDENGQLVTFE